MAQSLSLLSMPDEILESILDYAIDSRKLVPHELADAEWSRLCDAGRELPALLLASKVLSDKAARLFYGRCILECPVAQLPRFIFNSTERPSRSLDLAASHRVSFRHCPHIARIREVHLYSDQRDVIVGEGYEATLGFLVRHTAVERITLCSRRTMARIRRFPVDLDALVDMSMRPPDLNQTRKVYIYSKHSRCQYENQHVSTFRKRTGCCPPPVQTYLMTDQQEGDPILDPRWDTRGSSHWQRPAELAQVCDFISCLNSQDELLRMVPEEADGGMTFMGRAYSVVYVLKTHQSGYHEVKKGP